MPNPISLPLTDLKRRGLSLPPGTHTTGSYLVTFADGTQYAGATDNLVLRIGSHRRTWDDMERLLFWQDGRGSRTPIPDVVKWRLALPGAPLRKIDREHPGIDPVLDRMRWADEHLLSRHDIRPVERTDQRARTRPKFEALARHPDFDRIVALAGRYLALFVPAPAATEVAHWVITSMPSTVSTRLWHRLICLSINNVEALTIGTQFDGSGWTTVGFMSGNPADVPSAELLSPDLVAQGVFLAPAWYETVGPVYQIGFDSLDGLDATLRDEEILDLVGGLVMRLIKRGRGLYGRFHDYNLADLILRTALGRKPTTELATAKTELIE